MYVSGRTDPPFADQTNKSWLSVVSTKSYGKKGKGEELIKPGKKKKKLVGWEGGGLSDN